MTKEELQRALECAERCRDIDGMYWWGDVVDSLKAALEAKDEPFGFFQYDIRLDAWVQNRINNKGVAFFIKGKNNE